MNFYFIKNSEILKVTKCNSHARKWKKDTFDVDVKYAYYKYRQTMQIVINFLVYQN